VKTQSRFVVHACNPSTREDEAGGLRVQNEPGIHSETLTQEKRWKERNKTKQNKTHAYVPDTY
jgi:hypothetical protein